MSTAQTAVYKKQLSERLNCFVKHVKAQESYYNDYKTELRLQSQTAEQKIISAEKNIQFLEDQLEDLEAFNENLQQENDALRTENELLQEELQTQTFGAISLKKSKFQEVGRTNDAFNGKVEDLRCQIRQIYNILQQMRDNFVKNTENFCQFIDQLANFIITSHNELTCKLTETELNATHLRNSKVIKMVEREDFCFPTKEQFELLDRSFEQKERKFLNEYFAKGEISMFLEELLVKLECSVSELRQSWTNDVEEFVKGEAREEFGITEKNEIAKSKVDLYETDKQDDLITAWIMRCIFAEVAERTGDWV